MCERGRRQLVQREHRLLLQASGSSGVLPGLPQSNNPINDLRPCSARKVSSGGRVTRRRQHDRVRAEGPVDARLLAHVLGCGGGGAVAARGGLPSPLD